MKVIIFLGQIAGGIIVGKAIMFLIRTIMWVLDASADLMARCIKKDDYISIGAKYTVPVALTVLSAIAVSVVVGITYWKTATYVPVYAVHIIIKKAQNMPLSILCSMFGEILLSTILTVDQKRTVKILLFELLKDIFFLQASFKQVEDLLYYVINTIIVAINNTIRNCKKIKEEFPQHGHEMILLVLVIASAFVTAICFVSGLKNPDVATEFTTGFLSMIWGIALILNYARIQDMER